MAHEVAVDIITKGAGQHFDPDIAASFLEILPKIKQIADSLADN